MALSRPNIAIIFKKLAENFTNRTNTSNAILIIKDDTSTSSSIKEYMNLDEVIKDSALYTAENFQAVKDLFVSNINKATIVRIPTTGTMADALAICNGLETGYIGVFSSVAEDQEALITWVKAQEANKKSYYGVTALATAPDDFQIINLVNPQVTFADSRGLQAADKFIPSLISYLAGLDNENSATYLVMSNLFSVVEPEDIDTAINAGGLVLFNDEGKVRIVLGINSKTTLADNETEDMKFIEVIKAINLVKDDITSTYKNYYLGKYKNKYDNQIIFISAINDYYSQLAQNDILDPDFNNICDIDVEAKRQWLIENGKDEAKDWDDTKVEKYNYGRKIFIQSNIRILEAMTDLSFTNVLN